MDLSALTRSFAISDVLVFEETASGLIFMRVTTPAASAVVYLQGAHLTHWQPAGERPVLFTASQSDFAPGKAIRGGVPVVFPWFSTYTGEMRTGQTYPFHGFARTMPWTLASVVCVNEEIRLVFTLAPDGDARALGFDGFRLIYTMRIGRTLELEFTVHNDGQTPFRFEEALHTYYAVGSIESTTLSGLAGAAYLDNTDNLLPKQQHESILHFTGRRDSIYIDTGSPCRVHDASQHRDIVVEKTGSNSTVVWNPWSELVTPGLGPGEWRNFLCVETANLRNHAIVLAPGATHSMRAEISLSRE